MGGRVVLPSWRVRHGGKGDAAFLERATLPRSSWGVGDLGAAHGERSGMSSGVPDLLHTHSAPLRSSPLPKHTPSPSAPLPSPSTLRPPLSPQAALRPFVDQRSTLNYYADAAAAAATGGGGGAEGNAGGASAGTAAGGSSSGGPGADQQSGAAGGGAHEGGPVALSIRRLVLIVVADIGQDAIDRFLLAEGAAAATTGSGGSSGDASLLLRDRLMARLRRQLEDEWAGAGADLAGLVQSVVPFMPFAQVRRQQQGWW